MLHTIPYFSFAHFHPFNCSPERVKIEQAKNEEKDWVEHRKIGEKNEFIDSKELRLKRSDDIRTQLVHGWSHTYNFIREKKHHFLSCLYFALSVVIHCIVKLRMKWIWMKESISLWASINTEEEQSVRKWKRKKWMQSKENIMDIKD